MSADDEAFLRLLADASGMSFEAMLAIYVKIYGAG